MARIMKATKPKKPVTGKPAHGPVAASSRVAGHTPEKPADAQPQIIDRSTIVRLKDLIDRVVALSGAKRQSVKPVVEATLKVLGDALEAGENLVLPPLGRARLNRSKDTASGPMLTVKLKRGSAAKAGKSGDDEGLAEAGE